MKTRVLITAAVLALFTSCRKNAVEMVTPALLPITEAVFAPGYIEAANQFTLTAMNDGYINEALVVEGDTVNAGDILYLQDNAAAGIQQQTATENLHIAEQRAALNSSVLLQLQAQLDAATAKLDNDSWQLERMKRLYDTRSVAKIDMENAQLSYDNSLSNVAAIRQNIASTRLALRQDVINSRGQQQAAKVNSSYFNIRSPGIYRVYKLMKRKGDLVRKGEGVAILGNATDLKIVLNIDEASIAKVRLQQKVLVELNTGEGKTYMAYISKIYPAFDAASQAYTAEASFDATVASIINGTLLQANIIVDRKDKAMLIPRSCLVGDSKVVVRKKGASDTVTIKKGIVASEWVEVLEGLQMTDRIVKQQ